MSPSVSPSAYRAGLVALLLLALAPSVHADDGPYGWTISTSTTDPYANTSSPTGELRTVYLWFVCSVAEPHGPGGMAAATFKINSTSITHIATTLQNGYLNAGTQDDLLLAVGGCPPGPVIAARLTILDAPGGSMCLVPSVIKNGLMGTVNCGGLPQLFSMDWIGYSNTGAAPCSDGATDCGSINPLVDAGPDRETCTGVPVPIGGNPTALGGTPPYTYSWTPTSRAGRPRRCESVRHDLQSRQLHLCRARHGCRRRTRGPTPRR